MPGSLIGPSRETASGLRQTDRFRAEQVRILYRSGSVGVVGAMVGAIVLAGLVLYLGAGSPQLIEGWVSFLGLAAAGHLLLIRIYRRSNSQAAKWRAWAGGFTVFGFFEGISWGATAFHFSGPQDFDQRLITMLVTCGVVSGSGSSFGVYLPAFCALFFPATIPFIFASALPGGIEHYVVALLILVFTVATFLVQLRYNAGFMETLHVRFENLDLAEGLRLQKEAAEEANRAKSRFLAAASHDLRQPVHALGMFVGALKEQKMDAGQRRLVDHIDDSVAAMDGLFTALLDISKLDAGVVEPQFQAVAIQPLFDRLHRDFLEDADRKGLKLRFQRCSLQVHSDPVLLERILRNLISNAIKYTDHGRVVVGCRRGTSLTIQVCDSGCGIPAESAEQIFQEFFQLQNPERDRAKGLGLGLAIVRRLSIMLDHPLTLHSDPGRGSIFSLKVPVDDSARQQGADASPAVAAFKPGLILVIDDEIAVQEAMRSLLTSWGHSVVCAGSGSEIMQEIALQPKKPDIIISDYRLRNGETGIDVIRQLQSEYNEEIPAILVTGDSDPGRLSKVSEDGFLLLHKPVASAKLRAAIGNLRRASECIDN